MLVEVKNIKKSFGDLAVLKGIDLSISQGEFVSIVGASGAGKTTLLQIIGLLDQPEKGGSILFNDTDITQLNERKRAAFRNSHIGFIFQKHQLLPELTALENVLLPALIHKVSKAEATKRAKQLGDIVGLASRMDHRPAKLSGGESQRVAVARALINKPILILGDEPSGSLDSQNREELYNLFFELRDELRQTFVIVTHDEAFADRVDRKIRLVDGLIADPN